MKTKPVLMTIIAGVMILSLSLHNGLQNFEPQLHGKNAGMCHNHHVQISFAFPGHDVHTSYPGEDPKHKILSEEGGVKDREDEPTGHGIAKGIGEPVHSLSGSLHLSHGLTNDEPPISHSLAGTEVGNGLYFCQDAHNLLTKGGHFFSPEPLSTHGLV